MKRFIKPIIAVAIVVCLVVVYHFISPTEGAMARFVPKCPIKMLTGYDCPSCGFQRFLHALFNGEFKEAVLYNPFLALALPYLLALFYTTFSEDRFSTKVKPYVQHYVVAMCYLAMYIIWWVVRNTEWWLNTSERLL